MRLALILLVLLQFQATAQLEEPAHLVFGHSLVDLLGMSAQSRTYTSSDSLSAIHYFENGDTIASIVYERDDLERVIGTEYSGNLGDKNVRVDFDEEGRITSRCWTFQNDSKSCLELFYDRCKNPSMEIISNTEGTNDSIWYKYDEQCREIERKSSSGPLHLYQYDGENNVLKWSITENDTLGSLGKVFNEKGQLIETRSHRSDAHGRLKLNSVRSHTYLPNGLPYVISTFHVNEGVSTEQYVYDDRGRMLLFIERFNRFPERSVYRNEYQYDAQGKLHTFLEYDEMHQLRARLEYNESTLSIHVTDSYSKGTVIESSILIEFTKDGRLLSIEK